MSDNSSNRPPAITEDGKKVGKADRGSGPIAADAVASVISELEKSGMPRDRAAAVMRTILTSMATMHVGPLPTVRDFEGYDRVCPGAARDILDMAKQSQKHQHSIESAEVYGDLILKIIGNFTALGIVVAMLAAALYAAMNQHDALASVIASGTGLSMVAGVFVRNRMNKKQAPPQPPAREPQKRGKKRQA